MRRPIDTKTLANLSLALAISMILGYVESLIPILPQFPGIKLGLPNLVVLLLLSDKKNGLRNATLVNILRILLSAMLFGSFVRLLYALSGGVIAMLVMWGAGHLKKLSTAGVSVVGAVTHNIMQLLVAMILTKTTAVLFYLPIMLIFGAICGMINGVIVKQIQKYLRSKNRFTQE